MHTFQLKQSSHEDDLLSFPIRKVILAQLEPVQPAAQNIKSHISDNKSY